MGGPSCSVGLDHVSAGRGTWEGLLERRAVSEGAAEAVGTPAHHSPAGPWDPPTQATGCRGPGSHAEGLSPVPMSHRPGGPPPASPPSPVGAGLLRSCPWDRVLSGGTWEPSAEEARGRGRAPKDKSAISQPESLRPEWSPWVWPWPRSLGVLLGRSRLRTQPAAGRWRRTTRHGKRPGPTASPVPEPQADKDFRPTGSPASGQGQGVRGVTAVTECFPAWPIEPKTIAWEATPPSLQALIRDVSFGVKGLRLATPEGDRPLQPRISGLCSGFPLPLLGCLGAPLIETCSPDSQMPAASACLSVPRDRHVCLVEGTKAGAGGLSVS